MKKFYYCFLFTLFISIFLLNINTNSFAFTWSDYVDFCSNVNNSLITNNDTKWIANRVKNYRSQIETAIQNAGLNVNDYNSFYCYKERGSSDNYLFFWNSSQKTVTIRYNYKVSGTTYSIYIEGTSGLKAINIYNFATSNMSNINFGQNIAVGLIDGNTTTASNTDIYLQNQFIYSVVLFITLYIN